MPDEVPDRAAMPPCRVRAALRGGPDAVAPVVLRQPCVDSRHVMSKRPCVERQRVVIERPHVERRLVVAE